MKNSAQTPQIPAKRSLGTYALASALALLLVSAHHAQAQSTEMETLPVEAPAQMEALPETISDPSPSAIETAVELSPEIESLGYVPREDQRSLGGDLFRESTRSALIELIKDQPAVSQSEVLQKLTNQVLLTAAMTTELATNEPAMAGNDLLTFRMEKMLDRGLYAETAGIYSKLNVDPYHERFAAAGLTSLIMTGKKALACVDVKTFYGNRNDTERWKNFNLYCQYVIASSESPQKFEISKDETDISLILRNITTTPSYTLAYSPQVFETLSQFDRALLLAENRLTLDAQALDGGVKIPPNHIQALLQIPSLNLDTQLRLISEGTKTGTVSDRAVLDFYRTTKIDDKTTGSAADLIRIFKKLKSKDESTDVPALIKQTIRLSKSYGPSALIPFLPEIETLPPSLLEPEEVETTLSAFLAAGRQVSPGWLDSAMNPDSAPLEKNSMLYKRLLILGYLLSAPESRTPENQSEILSLLEQGKTPALPPMRYIIENIDKTAPPLNNEAKVYENGFDSTQNTGYTMPSAQLITRLQSASQKNAIGETILLSNLVFRDASAETPSPDALIEVTDSLKRIGLNDKSLALTAETVLAAIK